MKLLLCAVGAVLLAGCGIPESSAFAQAKAPADGAAATNSVAPATTPTNAVATVVPSVPPPAPELPPNLPEAAREIVKLSHSQIGDSVVTNFIANLKEPFHLDAEQIVYLRDLGLSPSVIEALLSKEQELSLRAPRKADPAPVATATAPPPAPATASPTLYPGGKPELESPQVGPAVPAPAPAQPSEPPSSGPTQVNYNFFYDSLAPYGNWFNVPTYGYVWQPSCAVITPGWRPYWNCGSWAWCDAGWYWNSSYSWGWAPFHYGNWVNSPGCGWCWVPGQTWSPSWVTFRYGGGYCGWAPLPPGCGVSAGVGLTWAGSGVSVGFGFGYSAADYCWTPTSYFTASNCSAYGVYGAGVHQIYNGSTVINNYVVGNNNTIINNGIDPSHIAPHSRSEIRKVRLTDTSSPNLAGSMAGTRGRPGDPTQLAVYRPPVGSSTTSSGTSGSSGALGARREVRPSQFANTSVPSTSTAPYRNLAGRPAANQPDRLPAPNPRTPAVAPMSQGTGSRAGISTPRPGIASRPTASPAVTGYAGQSLAARGNYPNGSAVPGGSAGAGRLEPRKAPVSSDLLPGEAASFQRPVAPRATSPSEAGGFRSPGGVQQSPVARVNPRPQISAPTPSFQRMPSASPQPTMSRPMPASGFNGGSRGGGGGSAGGGAAIRSRP